MNQASNHWGVELVGADRDKNIWRLQMRPPFDPYIEEVNHEQGKFLALRSKAFDGIAGIKAVHEIAKKLNQKLNAVISKFGCSDPVSFGAVVEFKSNGQPRKHHSIGMEAGMIRIQGSAVKPSVM